MRLSPPSFRRDLAQFDNCQSEISRLVDDLNRTVVNHREKWCAKPRAAPGFCSDFAPTLSRRALRASESPRAGCKDIVGFVLIEKPQTLLRKRRRTQFLRDVGSSDGVSGETNSSAAARACDRSRPRLHASQPDGPTCCQPLQRSLHRRMKRLAATTQPCARFAHRNLRAALRQTFYGRLLKNLAHRQFHSESFRTRETI